MCGKSPACCGDSQWSRSSDHGRWGRPRLPVRCLPATAARSFGLIWKIHAPPRVSPTPCWRWSRCKASWCWTRSSTAPICFALDQTVQHLRARPEECYFWATHAGAELDLLVVRGKQRVGFEFKRTDAPTLTPSMRHALHDLKLDRLWVVHAGRNQFPLGQRVEAIGLDDLIRKKTLAK